MKPILITELIEGDVVAGMSDDGNAGNKEVPDLLRQEIQIFSEEDNEAFAATLGDES